MILRAYTVFDNAIGEFRAPFFLHQDAEAIRAFKNMANDPTSLIGSNPNDFRLYYAGEYDTSTGEYILTERVSLGWANEYLNKE